MPWLPDEFELDGGAEIQGVAPEGKVGAIPVGGRLLLEEAVKLGDKDAVAPGAAIFVAALALPV